MRVRGSEVEFCKKGAGVPEWWHFPECDRHLYYGQEETSAPSAVSKAPPPPLTFSQHWSLACSAMGVFLSGAGRENGP